MTVMLHSVIKITKNSRFLQYHLNFRAKHQTFVANIQICVLRNFFFAKLKFHWRDIFGDFQNTVCSYFCDFRIN